MKFQRAITTDFFSTLSIAQVWESFACYTYKLPSLRYGKDIARFENNFADFIWAAPSQLLSIYRWSNAIYHGLKLLQIGEWDEVILPAYTCVVVVNAIKQTWAKPVFVDIDSVTLNMRADEVEKKLSDKTKLIFIQHSFWKPADIKNILELAQQKNIYTLEDCAHSLWTKIWEKHLWTFADVSIFSTGRDKVISSVTWWVLLVNNKDLLPGLEKIRSSLIMPTITTVLKNLNYNSLWYVASKTFLRCNIWKVIMYLSLRLRLITLILNKQEKNCSYKDHFNLALPSSLCYLASNGLTRLNQIQLHRRKIAELYDSQLDHPYVTPLMSWDSWESLNFYRYPIVFKTSDQMLSCVAYMKKAGILLGTAWSWTTIAPSSCDITSTGYESCSCPIAEDIASRIVMLPNHNSVTISDAHQVIQYINNFKK